MDQKKENGKRGSGHRRQENQGRLEKGQKAENVGKMRKRQNRVWATTEQEGHRAEGGEETERSEMSGEGCEEGERGAREMTSDDIIAP